MDKLEIIKLLLLTVWPIVIIGGYIVYKNIDNIKLKFKLYYNDIEWKYYLWKTGRLLSKKKEYFQNLVEIKQNNYKTLEEEEFDFTVTNFIRNTIDYNDMFIISKDNDTLEYDKNRISARFDKTKMRLKDEIKNIILDSFNYDKNKFRITLKIYFDKLNNKIIEEFNEYQNNALNDINNTKDKKYDKIFNSSENIVGLTENSVYTLAIYSFIYNIEVTEQSFKEFYDLFDKYFPQIIMGFIINKLQKRD